MSGLEMKYFVLKPKGDSDHAAASRAAMRAYAHELRVRDKDAHLRAELESWADREADAVKSDI